MLMRSRWMGRATGNGGKDTGMAETKLRLAAFFRCERLVHSSDRRNKNFDMTVLDRIETLHRTFRSQSAGLQFSH